MTQAIITNPKLAVQIQNEAAKINAQLAAAIKQLESEMGAKYPKI